jgi:sigma-B regulation protein RsbU (phosphoserine phosphatase)
MKRTLGTKMLIRIWGSTMILFLGVLWAGSYYSKQEVIRGIENESKNLAQFYTEKYDGRFGQAEKIAGMIALHMSVHPFYDESELTEYMKGVIQNNPEIYGTCIAFEPEAFAPGRALFAPYFYAKGRELVFVQLGTEQYNYFAWDWYKIPKQTGKPAWSEPYFDTGGGETIMITYSAPIFRAGRLIGVATVDICLADLAREVNGIRVLQTGYAFIVSKNGSFISYPDASLIMRQRLGELAPELAERMTSAASGFIDRSDPLHRKRSWIVYYPIRSANLSLAIVYPFLEVMSRVYAFEGTAVRLGLAGLLTLLLIVALVSRSIARPIVDLATAARKVAGGDLDFQLPPARSADEVAELTLAFNKMVHDLRYHMAALQKSTAERERIASELDVAFRIQQSILPRDFQTFSTATGFEIFAHSVPAREVGGDFYDFFPLGDDRIGFVIGDVSGKGVPAALFMAICRTLLAAVARGGSSPGDCLSHVNALLLRENEMQMFVTVIYGLLNVDTGEIQYANAGHNRPYLLTRDGAVAVQKSEPQIALGVLAGATYATRTIRLRAGDSLFLYTDGITEATDVQQEMYAAGRLEAALGKLARSSPADIIAGSFEEVRRFTGGAEQSDDITALALTFTGRARADVALRFANRLDETEKLHDLLSAFGRERGLSKDVTTAATLALEEILSNIIRYGFADGAEHFIDVRLATGPGGELHIRVEDDGRPFNPLDVAAADVHAPLDERRVGGLGVYLTRKMMDDVGYKRSNGKNIFTMTKRAKA